MSSDAIEKLTLRNGNILLAEHELTASGQKPTALVLSCPHCRKNGSFEAAINNHGVKYYKWTNSNMITPFFAVARICPNQSCKGLVFVVEHDGKPISVHPPQLINYQLDNLPPLCQATLQEAITCHAAGAYRAAAMMVRRLLEEICELNNAKGNTLHQKLEALKSLIVLPQALFDAMSELKALGNDAAHVEAKAYDNIGSDEAFDSIELAKEILKSLYQLQGLVSRLQSRKKS